MNNDELNSLGFATATFLKTYNTKDDPFIAIVIIYPREGSQATFTLGPQNFLDDKEFMMLIIKNALKQYIHGPSKRTGM